MSFTVGGAPAVVPTACLLPMVARVTHVAKLTYDDMGVTAEGRIKSTSPTGQRQLFCTELEIQSGMAGQLDALVAEFTRVSGGQAERRGTKVVVHFPNETYREALADMFGLATDLILQVVDKVAERTAAPRLD